MFVSQIIKGEEIFPLSDVKEGMKGDGFTVLKGEEKTRFEVTILGVQSISIGGKKMILCRVNGDEFSESGIIAGMSGSPVYIDNKFLGAVASTYIFSKSPICAITPAERMHQLYSKKPENKDDAYSSVINYDDFIRTFTKTTIDIESVVKPIKSAQFEIGKGKELPFLENAEVSPGDMIGVSLISGDLNLTAFGTVSSILNNQFVAFGHQFFGLGTVDFPAFKARVTTVVPSYALSMKIASSLNEIGKVTLDTNDGIVCKKGKRADMIQLQVQFEKEDGQSETKKVKFVRHNALSKVLLIISLSSLFDEVATNKENNFLILENCNFEFQNKKNLSLKKQVYGGEEPNLKLITFLSDIFSLLTSNPFEKTRIQNISLKVRMIPKRNEGEVLELKTSDKEIKKGDYINLEVLFHKYGEGMEKIETAIDSDNLPSGKVKIVVSDNISTFKRISKCSQTVPIDFDGLLKDLESIPEGGNIYLTLYCEAKQVESAGKRIFDLPPSIEVVMPETSSSVATSSEKVLLPPRTIKECGYFEGELEIGVNIKEREINEKY
jgi:hypothetical protein